MSLNTHRDEAKEFLLKIGASREGLQPKLDMLEEEFQLLKNAAGQPHALRHQVYDMLFLLFEIAAENDFDLDREWSAGKARKQEKYIDVSIHTRRGVK